MTRDQIAEAERLVAEWEPYPAVCDSLRCPLLAISRHPDGDARRSALPPKADIQIMIPGQAPANVRLTPNSGHKWVGRGMSAFDPKRTLP